MLQMRHADNGQTKHLDAMQTKHLDAANADPHQANVTPLPGRCWGMSCKDAPVCPSVIADARATVSQGQIESMWDDIHSVVKADAWPARADPLIQKCSWEGMVWGKMLTEYAGVICPSGKPCYATSYFSWKN